MLQSMRPIGQFPYLFSSLRQWRWVACAALVSAMQGNAWAQTDSALTGAFRATAAGFTRPADTLSEIGSGIPMLVRKTPGAVIVFTEQDITEIGARDLMDLLQLVPDFNFGWDNYGNLAPMVRGSAALTTILVNVDGVMMNEMFYNSIQWTQHFPITQLRRVEVIRGPGAVVYGNTACQAVINIFTKAGEGYNGVRTASTFGMSGNKESRQDVTVTVGRKGPNWSVAATMGSSTGLLSTRPYTDASGHTTDLSTNHILGNRFGSLILNYKSWSFQMTTDYYRQNTVDAWYTSTSKPYLIDFTTLNFSLRRNWVISPRLSVVAQARYRFVQPWKCTEAVAPQDSADATRYFKQDYRSGAALQANYTIASWLKAMLGYQFQHDLARDFNSFQGFVDGKERVRYTNQALLGQLVADYKLGQIIAGARLERHSFYGSTFAPRIACNKELGRFMLKAGYTRSYRLPSIEEMNLSQSGIIHPQLMETQELQLNYTITPKQSIGLVTYHINTKDIIEYTISDALEGYTNSGQYSTQGAEIRYQGRLGTMSWMGGYAYYATIASKYGSTDYAVPGTKLNIGIPANKFTYLLTAHYTKTLSTSLSGYIVSQRYAAYPNLDSAGAVAAPYLYRQMPWQAVVNAVINWRIPLAGGLQATAGIYNVTGTDIRYIQPYLGGHLPMPGMGREYVFRLIYEICN